MAFKHVLKSELEPKIPLKEMALMNTSSEGTTPANKETWRTSKQDSGNKDAAGKVEPLIQINDFIMQPKDITDVIIDETGFLPKITVIYDDSNENFSPVQFPGANPILSIYIKSTHDKMKPIRNDYIITSIRGNGTYIIKGELFIPKLYNNISKSYSNMNSKKAILEIARDMGLGFQSNECDPSDSMNWINPNWNSRDFIRHVASHAYQDEESFFQVFIDKYYYVNFVNVNLQIEADGEYDNTIFCGGTDYNISEDIQMESTKSASSIAMGLIKTPRITEGANVIMDKHLITDQGEILISNGFKKRIYYYDSSLSEKDPINKLIDFYVKPTISPHSNNKEKSLKPINEQLRNNEIKKWINIQYENTHSQYNAAKIINHHNLLEIDKIKLSVTTKGINFNATRGMRVPVGIYENSIDSQYGKAWENTQEQEKNPDQEEEVYNEFYSGTYYTSGNKYIYERGIGYNSNILLSKRDWIPNPVK